MKTLFGRTGILMLGVVFSLSVLVGGWEMNAWAIGAYENHSGIFPIVLTAALATIAFVTGMLILSVFVAGVYWGKVSRPLFQDLSDAALGIGNAACFCFVFGTLGFSLNHGLYVNPWDALLIAGFLPLLHFVKEIASDIGSALRMARGEGE